MVREGIHGEDRRSCRLSSPLLGLIPLASFLALSLPPGLVDRHEITVMIRALIAGVITPLRDRGERAFSFKALLPPFPLPLNLLTPALLGWDNAPLLNKWEGSERAIVCPSPPLLDFAAPVPPLCPVREEEGGGSLLWG